MVKEKEKKLLITDERFSGATRGFCVGHVGPEAALGGPIALLKNGDTIDIDAKKGTINVRLSKTQPLLEEKMEGKKSAFGSGTFGNTLKPLGQHTGATHQQEKEVKNILKFNED